MASAGTSNVKSPKTPRRVKTPDSRQVHFDGTQGKRAAASSSSAFDVNSNNEKITGFTSANSPSGGFNPKLEGFVPPKVPGFTAANTSGGTAAANDDEPSVSPQPSNFPQVGPPPGSAGGQLQWHTAANPTQSLSHQLPNASFIPGLSHQQPQQHYFPHPAQQHQVFPPPFITTTAPGVNTNTTFVHQNSSTTTPVTYIGIGPGSQQQQFPFNMSADYQNTSQPPTGLHFQPPVPDTTFGPIPHVYVPRFDGGLAGVQVGAPTPSFHFVSPPPPPPAHFAPTACTTVVLPKTFYLNGYTYYASGIFSLALLLFLFLLLFPCQVALDRVVKDFQIPMPWRTSNAPSFLVFAVLYSLSTPANTSL